MNLWFGKAAVIAALIGYSIIRGPYGQRSRSIRIVEDRKGPLEIALLGGAFLGTTILPLVWAFTGFPARADFPLHPVLYALGLVILVAALWLFYRSHTDLGRNWSITLQTRENHTLITTGIYQHIRHPMYASMFLLCLAHLLFVSNWIIAPVYFVSFWLLYIFRVPHEERLMLDRFGSQYQSYMERSGRLIPPLRHRRGR